MRASRPTLSSKRDICLPLLSSLCHSNCFGSLPLRPLRVNAAAHKMYLFISPELRQLDCSDLSAGVKTTSRRQLARRPDAYVSRFPLQRPLANQSWPQINTPRASSRSRQRGKYNAFSLFHVFAADYQRASRAIVLGTSYVGSEGVRLRKSPICRSLVARRRSPMAAVVVCLGVHPEAVVSLASRRLRSLHRVVVVAAAALSLARRQQHQLLQAAVCLGTAQQLQHLLAEGCLAERHNLQGRRYLGTTTPATRTIMRHLSLDRPVIACLATPRPSLSNPPGPSSRALQTRGHSNRSRTPTRACLATTFCQATSIRNHHS